MSDHGCIHLNNFKAAKGIQPYKVIHSFFVTSTSNEARLRKVTLHLFLSRSLVLSLSSLSFNPIPTVCMTFANTLLHLSLARERMSVS